MLSLKQTERSGNSFAMSPIPNTPPSHEISFWPSLLLSAVNIVVDLCLETGNFHGIVEQVGKCYAEGFGAGAEVG
jgi:hypothetical protein